MEKNMANRTVADIPPQIGKFAIVTGATGGLGFETALALALAGAEVVLAGRNPETGSIAVQKILSSLSYAKVRFQRLDLASLSSIRAFAEEISARGTPLDLLVNNAGVMALPVKRLTEDQFEMQFGTNHLGHFALTGLLLPLLRRAEAARVVNVSSIAHRHGKIDFDNLQAEHSYRSWPAYQQSKLANLLFTFELQTRSDLAGWRVMSNAAHPGFARTDLIAKGPGAGGIMGVAGIILRPLSHSAVAGALPTLFAATAPEAEPKGYYGPKGFYELIGPVAPAYVAPQATKTAVARKLWEVSEKLTGVRWPGVEQKEGSLLEK
jgi:NAD(P)-dependent dehydrogenase (short-subunit alcohol dehydrogenase family)